LKAVGSQLAGRKSVLFHGTRYHTSILRSGMLLFATSGAPVVCFSRSPEVAAYWATLPRDDDEGCGAVFVFDRSGGEPWRQGVDIGQDMVPLFSQHMGGEAEKRWIILHDKHCQRADGARAQQLGCAGETAWKLRHEETRGLLCPEVCADRI